MTQPQGDGDVLDGVPTDRSSSDAAPPPPGWYSDPDVPGRRRWWTGSDWGPEAAGTSARPRFGGINPLPVALFALGFMFTVMSLVLLFTPVTGGSRDCGSVLGGDGARDLGDAQFQAYNAAVCSDAVQQRGAVCLLMGMAGVGLLGSSFLVDRRAVDAPSAGDAPSGTDPGTATGATATGPGGQ